jgi:nicotinamide riboside transporter PnuC
MILRNPFKTLNRTEWLLWLLSITVIFNSFLLSGSFYLLTLIASMVGVTALIFVAKGDVWGQLLTVLFSLLYAVISLHFRYYGEMITYLGMTAPIAAMSVITWLRNPLRY